MSSENFFERYSAFLSFETVENIAKEAIEAP